MKPKRRGPHIVAIGGGTGLPTLLRGLKHKTPNITAIITVADDGEAPAQLRRELGLPPPGDFRNCIAALSDDEALTTQLFQYRFGVPVGRGGASNSDLSGHSFGNLFIAAMTGITGSFESGLARSGQVLAIQGRILPSTLADVTLVADVREQSQCDQRTVPGVGVDASGQTEEPDQSGVGQQVRRITGNSHIPTSNGAIQRVYLEPDQVPAYPAAVRAILTADLIVLGPGSLYTSVLPNLLIEGLCQALRTAAAPVVYVCNVATQPGETDGYETGDHLRALEQHVGSDVIDAMLVNNAYGFKGDLGDTLFVRQGRVEGTEVMSMDLIDEHHPWRHDSDKLAQAVLYIHEKKKEQSK